MNLPTRDGATPLHIAAFEGRLDMVRLLVRSGANVHAEDDEYNATAAGWAEHAARNLDRTDCLEVANFLEQREKKTWSAKTLPRRRQTHQVVKWKPIMDAAFDGDAARIKKLIAAGADPNAVSTTPGAHRPLHRAIEAKKTAPRGPKHEAAVTDEGHAACLAVIERYADKTLLAVKPPSACGRRCTGASRAA